MRVDFPAPLSPTRAVTLPAKTCMFTPLSTSTGPKLFRMLTRSMMGTSTSAPYSQGSDSPRAARSGSAADTRNGGRAPIFRRTTTARNRCLLRGLDARLVAGGLRVTGADVRVLGGTLVEGLLHVVLRDDDRVQRLERHAVGVLLVEARLLAVRQVDGELGARVGLELERLEDGAHLLALEDVLQAGDLTVLTLDHDGLAVLVQHRDGGRGVRVVR